VSDVIIFGASYAARMMRVYLERDTDHRVLGYTTDKAFIGEGEFDGRPIFAWEDLEITHPPGSVEILGPVSHREMNQLRLRKHAEAKARGYTLASFIHPTAQIYAEHIGEAPIILEYCIIQPGTVIGDGLICWSGSLIGHDCVLGDYCFLSAVCQLGGRSIIGDRCYLAGGARLTPGVTLGEETAVLNGGVVATNVPPRSVLKGPHERPLRVTSDRIHKLL